jgi:hypothetical protein
MILKRYMKLSMMPPKPTRESFPQPHEAKIHVNDSIQFTAQGYDKEDYPINVPFTFSMGNAGDESITLAGNFTGLKEPHG